jgi:toluene monooxygenase electron transfer component
VGSEAPPTRAHRVTLAGTDTTFEVAEGERILAAARRAGLWLPFECGWGSCATCKVGLVAGQVRLLFAGAPAADARDARRRRTLICQTTPCSDLIIKPLRTADEPLPELPTADYLGRLVSADEIGPGIRCFRFMLDRPAAYRAGQYAVVDLGAGLRRCYSMSCLPGSPVIEFVAKRQPGGAGSERLFALGPGDCVPVELPYGGMWLRDGTRPVVLVAGGTGISPVLALARALAATGDPRPVRVFYGAATSRELVCWEQLSAHVAGLPDGRLYGALESPPSYQDGWPIATGFVTDALAPHLEKVTEGDIYVAGPPPMVQAVLARLRDFDVQLHRIHYDSFG